MNLKSYLCRNGYWSVLFLILINFNTFSQGHNILLIYDVASLSNKFQTRLAELGHTVSQTSTFPSTLSTSTYDQVWDVRFITAGDYPAPTPSEQTIFKNFMIEGGRIVLLCDWGAGGTQGHRYIEDFVNDVTGKTGQSDELAISDITSGDYIGQYIQVDSNAAKLADPINYKDLLTSPTYQTNNPGYVPNTNLAGGYPVLQFSLDTTKKIGIAYNNTNLLPAYSESRLFLYTDFGNGMSEYINGTESLIKFIASFTTGASANISISPTTVNEDDSNQPLVDNTHTVNFAVTLTDTLDVDATVDYKITSVTAANGYDFNISPIEGTLTFSKGDTVAYIAIEIVDDYKHEGNETFEIKLKNGNPANKIKFLTGDSLVQTITIIDDDPEYSNIPIANTDSINLDEGATTTVLSYKNGETSVLWNDTDADTINGDALTVTLKTDVSYGTLTLNSNGTFEYAHNDNEFFTDQFTYTVTDKGNNTATGTVIISINPINDNWPDAKDTSFTVLEGGTLNIPADGILKYDSDIDVDQNNTTDYDWLHATLKSLDSTSYGTLTLNADGSFTYLHDGSENFTDNFTYYSIDSAGHKDSALVTINITPINDNSPVADTGKIIVDENGTATVFSDGKTTLISLVTDADEPNDNLTITNVSSALHGIFTLNADSTFSYINEGLGVEFTSDMVTYTVSDAEGNTTTGYILITINLINDEKPDASDNTINVANVGESQNVLANGNSSVLDDDTDLDSGDTKTATLLDSTKNGTLTLYSDGTFLYQHVTLANKSDSATYVITDGAGHKDTAKIKIGIDLKFENKPIATNDTISVDEDGTAVLLINNAASIFENDSGEDLLDKIKKGFILTNAKYGNFILDTTSGNFSYQHQDVEQFTDTLTYYIEDLGGQKDTAFIFININPVNDKSPEPFADTILVNEGGTATVLKDSSLSVLDNDKDIDVDQTNTAAYDSLFAIISDSSDDVSHGDLTLDSSGTFVYIHDGTENFTDEFVYTVIDAAGHTAKKIVTIIINPVNANPLAINDSILVKEGNIADTLTTGANSLILNDIDNDLNDIITADTTLIIPAKFGTFLLMSNGTFSYQHDGSENFIDSVTYQIYDKSWATSQATVYINITNVNDIPVVLPDSIIVKEGDSTTILVSGEKSVIANDSDADINGKSNWIVKLVTDVKFGSLFLDSTTGEFKYVHEGSQNYLNEFFKYKIIDGDLESEIITVPITIIPTLSLVKYASYYDVDGNGHIDSIVFIFDKPIIDMDSLDLSLAWNDDPQNIYPVSSENITSVKSKDTLIVNVENLFSTQLQTSGGLLAMVNYKDFDSTVLYPVADKAAPVITRAEYQFRQFDNPEDPTGSDSARFDALVVNFSESIKTINGDYPFNFQKNNTDKNEYQMELDLVSLDSTQAVFKVLSFKGAFYADKNDSTWIFADTADNPSLYISDSFNNRQKAAQNRRVPLILETPKLEVKVQILHIVGKEKSDTEIPDLLQVEGVNFTQGAVIIVSSKNPGNAQEEEDHLNSARKQIAIFDLVGNEVISVDNSNSKYLAMEVKTVAGKPSLVINWNGMNSKGRAVASGSYVIIIKFTEDEMFESKNNDIVEKINVKQFLE